ncbi:hypothetical protein VitviT2T_008567 [Vitis vinifera]|uniref:Uncharacterized protein n=1 Tax=Vitis vinifera TaxID=29760 RepID=A0ABY9C2X9_VITVI|nr:hypothetical protein VitviT2T_008567 [Vitis vinifera]
MSSIGTSKGILEIGKFAFYVSIPIDLMYTLANNSENMKKLVHKIMYLETGSKRDRRVKMISLGAGLRLGSGKHMLTLNHKIVWIMRDKTEVQKWKTNVV